jgi:hypothetical protein
MKRQDYDDDGTSCAVSKETELHIVMSSKQCLFASSIFLSTVRFSICFSFLSLSSVLTRKFCRRENPISIASPRAVASNALQCSMLHAACCYVLFIWGWSHEFIHTGTLPRWGEKDDVKFSFTSTAEEDSRAFCHSRRVFLINIINSKQWIKLVQFSIRQRRKETITHFVVANVQF